MYRQVSKQKSQVFAVCDGMGGEEAGEEASYTAVSSLTGLSYSKFDDMSNNIRAYVKKVNDNINQRINELGKRMGSTLAMLCILGNKAVTAHMGDSRIYVYHKERLIQLTEDHTQAQSLVIQGTLTPEQAAQDRRRHVLTLMLGGNQQDAVNVVIGTPMVINKKDTILICSDGLTEMVSDDKISAILSLDIPCSEKSKRLVNTALEAGGRDNVTTLVIQQL